MLYEAYARLETELVADTLCLVTRCLGLPELFSEKAAAPRNRQRELKGMKDARHLQILRESDPCAPRAGKAEAERENIPNGRSLS